MNACAIEWKPVNGYENLYDVSSDGRIRRIASWDNKNNGYREATGELKLEKSKNGYIRVKLSKDGKRQRYLVHRIVAQAFIENPNNYPQINHKDCNKANNSVDNLEWVTRSQNIQHAFKNGLYALTEKQREARRNNGLKFVKNLNGAQFSKKSVLVKYPNKIVKYDSCTECANDLNINFQYLTRLCREKRYYKKLGVSFEYEH